MSYNLWNVAQPYQTADLINIIGISYWSSTTYYGNRNAYICIADDTLGILRKAKINNYVDSTTGEAIYNPYHYTEIFFDTSIIVDSLFYIIVDNPKAYPFDEELYNWRGKGSSERDEIYDTRLFFIRDCSDLTHPLLWRKCFISTIDTTKVMID